MQAVSIRKYNGNAENDYAIFIGSDVHPVSSRLTKLTRRQAAYYKAQIQARTRIRLRQLSGRA